MSKTIIFLLACWCGIEVANAKTAANPPFMLVSGISAPEEMCVVVENGSVDVEGAEILIESCAAAIAAGDGRELWQSSPNGQISNVVSGKCVGLLDNEVSNEGSVALMDCDGASAAGDARSVWESQGNGQLKLGRAGQYCLSQRGSEAGVEDVAAKAAIIASSFADAEAHGASMAVDGRSSTFWASALDPAEPVALTIDFGASKKIQAINIQWEHPAKSFSVSLTADGVKWQEVFATDSNVLGTTNIPIGHVRATKARVVMHEAHANRGAIQGHTVYGIKALNVFSPRLRSVVEDCADASQSHDARDKFFQTYVSESNPCSSKALRSELPSFEAARASLAGAAAELVGLLPQLEACGHGAASFHKGTQLARLNLEVSQKTERASVAHGVSQLALDVERQNGADLGGAKALMKEARAAILAVRHVVF